ncbi:glutathione S-transferase family protein [Novosphingobium sp. PS1R-30]|uniref:Glutathione S-transferase family protein n=1 Tax=Novosphingobium anseongense TaxID=3133436 RepID=A0ABU8RQQ2_9SPHN
MPIDPQAETVLVALKNVPAFAHGLVRDLRVRWALEEIDRSYRTEIYEAMTPRPDGYREAWQPFGQVPALEADGVRLFESGAILLHLGEQDERLLPREPQARGDAYSWLIAALNTVEPAVMDLQWVDVFRAREGWTKEARPGFVDFLRVRLTHLEEAMEPDTWLAGTFSIADILMVTVLREIRHTDILDDYPKLKAYKERGEVRPAFIQALADQAGDLGAPIKLGEPA